MPETRKEQIIGLLNRFILEISKMRLDKNILYELELLRDVLKGYGKLVVYLDANAYTYSVCVPIPTIYHYPLCKRFDKTAEFGDMYDVVTLTIVEVLPNILSNVLISIIWNASEIGASEEKINELDEIVQKIAEIVNAT